MAPRVRYRSVVADNARWDGFEFRDDDIVISTPPKCGTTWTQMICALLIFGGPDLDRPLDLISPWLEQTLRPRDSVVADLEAQTHRRFIKSHTPLDGLPFDERVTYITVGRDPRDVAISEAHHVDNTDIDEFLRLVDSAVGLETLADVMPTELPAPTESPRDRFWEWVDAVPKAGQAISALPATLHHLLTFWEQRSRPNVVLLHFDDLRGDLAGQIRWVAHRLGIDVDESRLPDLVRAASFEEMRARAGSVAPNTTEPIWRDTASFFHSGTSGQWREILDPSDLRRYAERVAELIPGEMSDWLHRGPIEGS